MVIFQVLSTQNEQFLIIFAVTDNYEENRRTINPVGNSR